MLKAAFLNPLFLSKFPNKYKIPKASTSVSVTNTSLPNPPTVCEIASTNTTSTPLIPSHPTSAYIHLPFCRKRCHYCDFPIVALGTSAKLTEDDPRIVNYVQLICQEIDTSKSKSSNNPPLKTVFFGGGTPSLVPPRLVGAILSTLRLKFGLCPNPEISIEMDPGTFDMRKIKELMELGVNRVSLGVQAFQEEMLKGCGRAHGVEEVYEAIEIVKSCGVDNWSMDLISSLPHQTPEVWEESLGLAIEARPTHISVYDLQVEQGTKFGLWGVLRWPGSAISLLTFELNKFQAVILRKLQLQRGGKINMGTMGTCLSHLPRSHTKYTPGEFPLPSETQSAKFYRMASETLSNAGYNHYEISSYCKNGYECNHNLAYWQNKSFYGFGLGSASYINGLRFSRPKKLKDYSAYVQKLTEGQVNDDDHDNYIDAKDMAMDVVMLSLRTARGLEVRYFGRAFGKALLLSLCEAFKPYVESGHVVVLDEKRRPLCLHEFGLLLSDECEIECAEAFIRLSDPDGFLLSNELIAIAFGIISP